MPTASGLAPEMDSDEDYDIDVPDIEALRTILEQNRPNLEEYNEFYREVHKNPELPGFEHNTALLVTEHLERLNFFVHQGIGGHGIAAVYQNGHGKTVLLRAELDAADSMEQTDLEYKSEKRMHDEDGHDRPVMHSCGHDMNMAMLLAAAHLLITCAENWAGTLILVFQAGTTNVMSGAEAMVRDGLYDRIPVPDLMLAQHVAPSRAGTIQIRPMGPIFASADLVQIRTFGGGGPDVANPYMGNTVDVAIDAVYRLKRAVETADRPGDRAPVECIRLHCGVDSTTGMPHADIALHISTTTPGRRTQVLDFVLRHMEEECRNAGVEAPLSFIAATDPLTVNDIRIAGPIAQVFEDHLGEDCQDMPLKYASEDFAGLAGPHNVPYAYWDVGSTPSAQLQDPLPKISSPFFAPALAPTLRNGMDAMALAVLTFLS